MAGSPVPGWLRTDPICLWLVRLFQSYPPSPGRLSPGWTVNPVVLFWGDNAAGPAAYLTGLLWLREKRALSGQQSRSLQFNGALYVCTPGMLGCSMPALGRPHPLLEQMGTLRPREGVEGPPVDPSSLHLSPLP